MAAARQEWIKVAEDTLRSAPKAAQDAAKAECEQRRGSDFLAPVDAEGNVIDFHALRHTFGTWHALGGTAPKVLMDLMRHSDVNLTMRYYTHTDVADLAQAQTRLPDLSGRPRRQVRATGTDGVVAAPAPETAQHQAQHTRSSQRHPVAPNGTLSGASRTVASAAQPPSAQGEKRVSATEQGKATGGTRTLNLRFTKPLLCQLSYGGEISLIRCQLRYLLILAAAASFSRIYKRENKRENRSRSRTGSAVHCARSRPRCRHLSTAMSKPTNTTAVSLSQCGSPATESPRIASFTCAPRTTPPPDAEPGRSSTWTTPRSRGRSSATSPTAS